MQNKKKQKLFIIDSEDWTFWFHRRSLALSAKESGYDVTVLTRVNEYENRIKDTGIHLCNIDFVRSSRSPVKDIFNIIKLFRIFKREQPDIIHNIALKTILVSSTAAFFSRSPVVLNAFTGLGYVFSANKIQARVIRKLIKPLLHFLIQRKNCWTIFQNSDDMNLFKESGFYHPERTALILGSGVDKNEFSPSPDLNQIPVVMLASRMLWDKGIGEFVEVAKRMQYNNIKAKFVLVGDNDPDNPMSIPLSQLEQWKKEGYVFWDGHCDVMPEMLATSSIVCLPSYREGLPKVLLEAASVARPLVATDVPGCREIVKNGKNGILVKMKDVDALYSAILTLIDNKELREKMGKKSRTLIETEFSTEIINKQILDLYLSAQNHVSV